MASINCKTSVKRPSSVEPRTEIMIGRFMSALKAMTRFPPAKSVKPVLEAIKFGILSTKILVLLAKYEPSAEVNSRFLYRVASKIYFG